MATNSDIRQQGRDRLVGMEIVEITPIIVGGSPTDPQNKTALTRQQHFEFVRYWNGVIQQLRNQKGVK